MKTGNLRSLKAACKKKAREECRKRGKSEIFEEIAVEYISEIENAPKLLQSLKSDIERQNKVLANMLAEAQDISNVCAALVDGADASSEAIAKIDARLKKLESDDDAVFDVFENYETVFDTLHDGDDSIMQILKDSERSKLEKLVENAMELLKRSETQIKEIETAVRQFRKTHQEAVRLRQMVATKVALRAAKSLYDEARKLSEKSEASACEELAANIKASSVALAELVETNLTKFSYYGPMPQLGWGRRAVDPYAEPTNELEDGCYLIEPQRVRLYQDDALVNFVNEWIPAIELSPRFEAANSFLKLCDQELRQLNGQREAFVKQALAVENSALGGVAQEAELAKALEAHKMYEEFKAAVNKRCETLLTQTTATATYDGKKMEPALTLARIASERAAATKNNAAAGKYLADNAAALNKRVGDARAIFGKVISSANNLEVERAVKDMDKAVAKARASAK